MQDEPRSLRETEQPKPLEGSIRALKEASVTTPQADREAAQQKLVDADQDRLEALRGKYA